MKIPTTTPVRYLLNANVLDPDEKQFINKLVDVENSTLQDVLDASENVHNSFDNDDVNARIVTLVIKKICGE